MKLLSRAKQVSGSIPLSSFTETEGFKELMENDENDRVLLLCPSNYLLFRERSECFKAETLKYTQSRDDHTKSELKRDTLVVLEILLGSR